MKYSYEYKRMRVELYRQGKWPETPEGLPLGIDLACQGTYGPVAGGKAEEGVRLRLHFFREVFGNLADAAPHGPEPRQGADAADFDADALAALRLQRFGAHLPDHAPGVEKAVVGG